MAQPVAIVCPAKEIKRHDAAFRKETVIDIDATLAGTTGACKVGMDIGYNGIWG